MSWQHPREFLHRVVICRPSVVCQKIFACTDSGEFPRNKSRQRGGPRHNRRELVSFGGCEWIGVIFITPACSAFYSGALFIAVTSPLRVWIYIELFSNTEITRINRSGSLSRSTRMIFAAPIKLSVANRGMRMLDDETQSGMEFYNELGTGLFLVKRPFNRTKIGSPCNPLRNWITQPDYWFLPLSTVMRIYYNAL